MLREGDSVGSYTLIKRIAYDSFGGVWLAEKRALNLKVRLAFLERGEFDFDKVINNAALWMQAGAHPNVEGVLDAEICDGRIVVATEYISDKLLSDWLRRNGGKVTSFNDAVEITLGILEGLKHLHEHNIIYGDLKPDNILLEGLTPRLAFSHQYSRDDAYEGAIVAGAPIYTSPEAFSGNRTEQTDLWAAGAILYEMLAGRTPFPQHNFSQLIGAILGGVFIELPPTVPSGLRDVVKKALEKDLDKRYRTATKMRSDLLRAYQNAKMQPSATVDSMPSAGINYCDECGARVEEGTLYCARCGTPQPLSGAPVGSAPPMVSAPTTQESVFEGSPVAPTQSRGREYTPLEPPRPQSIEQGPPSFGHAGMPKSSSSGSLLSKIADGVSGITDLIKSRLRRSSAAGEKISEDVNCTAFAPPSVPRGAAFLLQVFAHLPGEESAIISLAKEADEKTERRGAQTLTAAVEHGARLDFYLVIHGMEVDEPRASLIWRGKPSAVQFGVRVPEEHPMGDAIGTVHISMNGAPVGRIKFKLTVLPAYATFLPPEPLGGSYNYSNAFISYASADRPAALQYAQKLSRLRVNVFEDVLKFDAEQRWLRGLYQRIDESDLFLLCWSKAASQSSAVQKEASYALARQRNSEAQLPDIWPMASDGAMLSLPELLMRGFISSDPNAETEPFLDPARTAPSPEDADLKYLIGRAINGRYVIEKQIAEGGFGAVYKARDEQLVSRAVVIKFLRDAALRNQWALDKFQHEIEALARISHPDVVGILDAGRLPNGAPYLVMQYVDGQGLRSVMRERRLELIEAAHILKRASYALEEAHSKGVLHRDLKPENIMLRRLTAGETHVVVIDFGIAKVRDSVSAPSTITGNTAGTYLYMSPEQLRAETLTPASDVFTLGVIAYELVTGAMPFRAATPVQLFEKHAQGVQVKPTDLCPQLSSSAQDVILKALSYYPAERYQRAREFGDEFDCSVRASD